jgi:hypothetical protein
MSEMSWFKFTVSLLCDDYIAAETFIVKVLSTARYDSSLSALSEDYSFQGLTLY